MKRIQKIWLATLVLIFMLLIFSVIYTSDSVHSEMESEAVAVASIELTEYDKDISYDGATVITLADDMTVITGNGATYEEGKINIFAPGTYYLTGTLTQGAICVNVYEDEIVHLVLDNVEVNAAGQPAIYIESAFKTIITSEEGSNNIFTDSSVRDKVLNVNACIYSNSDVTFNGEGTISCWGYYEDAIASTGTIKVVSGSYYLSAVDDGIRGRDGVIIKDGVFNIQTEGTCIKSTHGTNVEKGKVWIGGGNFTLIGGEHAISAIRSISVSSCEIFYQTILEPFSCQEVVNIEEGCIMNATD